MIESTNTLKSIIKGDKDEVDSKREIKDYWTR